MKVLKSKRLLVPIALVAISTSVYFFSSKIDHANEKLLQANVHHTGAKLSAHNMFEVPVVLQAHSELKAAKKDALHIFEQAKSLAGKEKADKLIASILTCPTAEAYASYAALHSEEQADVALNAYKVAVHLPSEIKDQIQLDYAKLAYTEGQQNYAFDLVTQAIQTNKKNFDVVLKDPAFYYLRANEHATLASLMVKTHNMNQKEAQTSLLLSLFHKPTLPFVVNANEQTNPTVDQLVIDGQISATLPYDFVGLLGMQVAYYGRGGIDEYVPCMRIDVSEEVVALVYYKNPWSEYANALFASTINKKTGELIEYIALGESESRTFDELSFHSDMTITKKVFEKVFEKDPATHGYYDNEVVDKIEKNSKETLKINPNGTFQVHKGFAKHAQVQQFNTLWDN